MRGWRLGSVFAWWVTLFGSTATSVAGENAGAKAWLSWNPLMQVTDTTPAATNNLYIRVTRDAGLSLLGAEIDLTWNPAGDGAGCFDHIGTNYKTSAGTTCTYLNRGTTVPVVTADDPSHLHVAWANHAIVTGCTAGAIIQIQFETDTCEGPMQGIFFLNL
jgi:hypothetical protein